MVLSRAQPSMARVDAARRGEEATSAHNRQSLEAMVECQSMSSFSFLAQTLFGSQKLLQSDMSMDPSGFGISMG